jgi:cysteine desulfurase/selenocysteine lyase
MSTLARPDHRPSEASPNFDVEKIRRDFPFLDRQLRGKPVVYLDNAATAQKPQTVIDALQRYYLSQCANIHRSANWLGGLATTAYEDARGKVQRFINAADSREVIFVRGATEAINLVAGTYGRSNVAAGDEIVVTTMEHHSNIVPWQMLAEEKGARLRVAPIDNDGQLRLEEYEKLLGPRTKLVAVTHVSNALGTVAPVARLVEMAHGWNVPVLVDGAQAAPHLPVDVRQLDCDFYAFSGHKLFGPTGIGVLWGKQELLQAMPPYQAGGGMIRSVTFGKTIYEDPPHRFEAGTPHIAGAIGLGAAIDYLNSIGRAEAAAYERELLDYATQALSTVEGLRLVGTAEDHAAVLSFVLEGIHPHDVGTILDTEGIVVRTGQHCAQPAMDRFGVPATTRASLAFYNTKSEIDALVEGIFKVKEFFQ